MTDTCLPIAVRAFAEWRPRNVRPIRPWRLPEAALVLDTETTTEATQRLLFGGYRYLRVACRSGRLSASCAEEGLFYADDLPEHDPKGMATLRRYASGHEADVVAGASHRLRLRSRREFVDRVLYPTACKTQATVVTFNALFDLSRLAMTVKPARGHFQGGFSFVLWQYQDGTGSWHEDKYRPRITIKQIDSKRALKRFTAPRKVEAADLVVHEPEDGHDDGVVTAGGSLLDLRQLVYTLTDQGHSLESACSVFGVPYTKREVEHGKITPRYVTYNREDVSATGELYAKAIEEYARCCPSA